MRAVRRFLRCERGSPAVEMALLLPMLLPLLFGGLEAANFFWSEHKLVKAVREGARFASRQGVDELCNAATPAMSAQLEGEIKLLTRTGQLADPNAIPKVPGWSEGQVDVTVACQGFVDTGLYSGLGGAGPIVSVAAVGVSYPSLMGELGIVDPDIDMSAEAHAPVIGI